MSKASEKKNLQEMIKLMSPEERRRHLRAFKASLLRQAKGGKPIVPERILPPENHEMT